MAEIENSFKINLLKHKIRPAVFYPPFLLLLFSVLASIFIPDAFLSATKSINNWILQHFDGLFFWATFAFLILVGVTFFLKFSNIKIGGKDAEPILKRWSWFAITLCTTIATGILFWATAEPMFHLHEGPTAIGKSTSFAMSTVIMHWTLIPYGMYTLAGIVFAIGYYNLKQPFAVSTLFYPILGDKAHGTFGKIADGICLFALVAGMAASLGAGVMAISGGIDRYFNITPSTFIYGLICIVVVVAFIISASTGLTKGIRFLSVFNLRLFILLALLIFILGPTIAMLQYGIDGTLDFIINFVPRAAGLDSDLNDIWKRNWTVFNWAIWLAWTPITALFLGRLAVGYTVREFIVFNLILPCIFTVFWMTIFSGTTLHLDVISGGEVYASLVKNGPQSVMYEIFNRLPFSGILGGIFLLSIFVSYVTAADSNTSAMTSMSVTGISPKDPEAPVWLKIVWGIMVGATAWVMISFAGVDGIKMISNLGGFPALFLLILVAAALVALWRKTKELKEEEEF